MSAPPPPSPSSARTGGVHISLLRVLPETLLRRGLDPAPVWARMGVADPDATQQTRVSLADWSAALDVGVRLTGDPALPLWAAQSVRPLHLGHLGYALLSSLRGADGLAVFAQFQAQLCDTLTVRMVPEGPVVALHHEPLGVTLPRHAGFWCFLFAARLAFARWVFGQDLVPASMQLPGPEPDAALAEAFRRFAGCPVMFAQAEAVERIPSIWLNWLNPNADAALHALMQDRLQRAQVPADDGARLLQRMRHAAEQLMAQGQELDMAHVLHQMRQTTPAEPTPTARQLQDRLAALGLSFKRLMDQIRRDQALQLLRDSPMPLGEVARTCGYAEPSPFHRAVKRWTGLTPAQVRDEALRPPPLRADEPP